MQPRTTTPPSRSDRINLDGREITYVIKTSPRARYVRLEIRPGSGLTVVVPTNCPISKARSFVKEKQAWVLEKLAKVAVNPTPRHKDGLRSGEVLPYLGRKLKIAIDDTSEKYHRVTLDGQTLRIGMANQTASPRWLAEQWYRTQADTVIRGKVRERALAQQVGYNRVTLRDQRTLWGSCSRKRNLSFNWRLMMAPEAVVDYVIVHELAHLREMNHSAKFWQIVAKHCPDWRIHRKWLRQHSAELAGMLRDDRDMELQTSPRHPSP